MNIGIITGTGNDMRAAKLSAVIAKQFPSASVSTINLHAMISNYWIAKPGTKNKRVIGPGGRENFERQFKRVAERYDAFVTYDLAFANHVLPPDDAASLNDVDVLGGMLTTVFDKPVLFVPDPLTLYGRMYDPESRAASGLMLTFFLRKLFNRIHGIERPTRPMKFMVPTTIAQLRDCVKLAARSTLIATDVETSNGCVSVVGFACNDPKNPSVIPTFAIPLSIRLPESNGLYWETEIETKLALDCLAEILDNDVPKVMHNGAYDTTYFFRMGMPPNNYIFDTMLMMHSLWPSMSRALYVGTALFLPNYRYWKDDAKEVGDDNKTKWQVPDTPKRLWNYWYYNGQDCANTLELCLSMLEYFNGNEGGIWPDAPYDFALIWRTYIREFAIEHGPCMYMSMTGMKADPERQMAMTAKLHAEAQKATDRLRWICSDSELNPQAHAQIGKILYDGLGMQPDRRKGRSTDKRIVQRIADKHPMFEDLIKAITSAKEPANNASKYGIALDGNKGFPYFKGDRWLYQMKAAATTTRRLASSKHNYGFGCVRPDAMALTPDGWKAMTEIRDGDQIMQWSDGKLEFKPCTMHWFEEDQSLLEIQHRQLRLAVTKNHRTVSMNNRGTTWKEMPAVAACRKGRRIYPVAGAHIGGTKEMPAYVAMLLADFSKDSRGYYGAFRKERKKLRVRKLCQEAGLVYHEREELREGYTRFTITNVPEDLPSTWGPWILELTQEALSAIVAEAAHWDSHVRGDSFIFWTSKRAEAEWFQTACVLSGHGATLRYQDQPEGSYSTTPMYSVNVRPRWHCRVDRSHWAEVQYRGKVCCPSVPSTFWLVKQGDFISVTGNTNMQNVPASMREVCVADKGECLCSIDYSQSDSYFVAFESQDHNMMEVVTDDRDTHSVHVEFFFGYPYADVVKGADEKAAWVVDPVTGVRQIIKKVSHGTNYDMGGETMLLNVRRPAAIAMCNALLGSANALLFMKYMGLDNTRPPTYYIEHSSMWSDQQLAKACDFAQALYYKRYPTLAKWKRRSVTEACVTSGLIVMFGGSTTTMLCNPNDNPRFVPAAYGQGGTAGNINNAMLRLYYLNEAMWARGFRLILQVHDELITGIPLDDMELIDQQIAIMETPCTIHGRSFTIPVDAELSLSWTKKKTLKWDKLAPKSKQERLEALEAEERKVKSNFGI